MDFDRVFWLDDHPIFLPWLQQGLHPSFSELMNRTTVALDTNEGASIVAEQEFDLYVLDADVPDVSDYNRGRLRQFIADLISGKEVRINDYVRKPGSGCDDFVAFYFDHLKDKIPEDAKVVVCSVSKDAMASAYALGLPGYVKGVGRKSSVERWVWHVVNKRLFSNPVFDAMVDGSIGKNDDDYFLRLKGDGMQAVKDWEKGDLDDLVHKYLL